MASQATEIRMSEAKTTPSPQRDEIPVPEIPGYEILEVLGQGGMGIVYKALDCRLGRHVAIKMVATGPIVTESTRERFHAEARAVALLQHPHIAQVFLAETIESRPYFVMEYVDGGPLSGVIAGEPQSPSYAATLMSKLAEAIEFSHSKNVLHRDLKPGNVILTREGEPKVADFGLAKFLDGDSGSTKTGDILGTPSYMSPEQAGGVVKNIGAPSDIYSLGAILYELLTGRPPFRTPDPMQTVLMVICDDPVPPRKLQPTVPKDLETICLKCLEKSPAKRYASAGELAADLKRFLADEPILARPVGRIERLLKWTRRRPALATLFCVSVLGIITAITATAYHTRQIEQALEETQAERDKARRLSSQLETSLTETKSQRDKARRLSSQLEVSLTETKSERDRAQQLSREIKAALTETQTQRDRAERLFANGHRLAKYLSSDHYEKLEALPGGAGPRESLSSNMIEYLARLEKDAQNNVELLTDLADAYQQIAIVQGNPYAENRGAKNVALKNYQKALDLRRRLVALSPKAAEPKMLLLLCRAQITDVKFQMGQVVEARRAYGDILQKLEQLRIEAPAENRILVSIVELLARLGDVDEAEEKLSAALARYKTALKRSEGFTTSNADRQKSNAAARNRLHYRAGQLLEKMRRNDEAEKQYLLVYEYAQQQMKDDPRNVFSRNGLSSALVALGDVCANRKQFTKARDYYGKALTIRRQSVRDDPRADKPQTNLAVILSRLGISFFSDTSIKTADGARQAAGYLEEALQIRRNQAKRYRNDIESVKSLAVVQRQLADVLAPTPQFERAEELYRACLATAENLKRMQPGSLIAEEFTAESLRGLATIEYVYGENAHRNKEFDKAKSHFRKSLSQMSRSIATWKAYHERNPNSPRTRSLEKSALQIQKLIEAEVKGKL